MTNHKKAEVGMPVILITALLILAAFNLPISIVFAQANTYTVTLQSNGNGQVSPNGSQIYSSQGPIAISATANPGYSFLSWTVNPPGAVTFDNPNLANPQITIISNGSTVSATFKQDTYHVNVTVLPSPTMGTVDLSASEPYLFGENVILTANPANGYSFDSWAGAGTNSGQYRVLTMTNNWSVSAFFTASPYTLSLNKIGSGTVYANGTALAKDATYHYQDTVELNAVGPSGWVFSGWSGSFTSIQNPVNIKINGTTSVVATFTHSQYSVTVNVLPGPSAGSFVSNQSGPLYLGDTVSLTANSAPGYSFNGWSGAGSGTGTTRTVSVTGNMVLYLTFTQNSYALSVSVTGSGSVNPTQGTYHYGDKVELTATPTSGWGFSGWSNAFTSSENPIKITINGTTSVLATFTQTTYQITFDTSTGGTINPTGTQTYLQGQYVPIIATPADSYTFTAWTASPAGAVTFDNANSASAIAKIDGKGVITATFTPKPTPTPSPTTLPTSNPTSSPTNNPTINPTQSTPTKTPTPTPSPTPAPGTEVRINALTIDGKNATLTIGGNTASSTISSATITTDQSNTTTTVSLAVIAQNNLSGSGKITIPKSAIPYGTIPIIYVNNDQAPDQGYTQDEKNYYLSYSTQTPTYELSITFGSNPPSGSFPYWAVLTIVITAAVALVTIFMYRKKRTTSLANISLRPNVL